jgi:hypothetical protein
LCSGPARVTAQRINGLNGGPVWSKRHDRKIEDALDLHDEIACNLVASVQTGVHLRTIVARMQRGATMKAAYAIGRCAKQPDDSAEYADWALGINCWGALKHDPPIAAPECAVDLNPDVLVACGGRDDAIANQDIAAP